MSYLKSFSCAPKTDEFGSVNDLYVLLSWEHVSTEVRVCEQQIWIKTKQ